MSVTSISHKGKNIIFTDYTSCKTTEELIAKMLETEKFTLAQQGPVLSAADVTGTRLNGEFMKEAKTMAKRSLNDKITKGALLGVTGMKKALLLGLNLVTSIKWIPFETKEEALDYLVENN